MEEIGEGTDYWTEGPKGARPGDAQYEKVEKIGKGTDYWTEVA